MNSGGQPQLSIKQNTAKAILTFQSSRSHQLARIENAKMTKVGANSAVRVIVTGPDAGQHLNLAFKPPSSPWEPIWYLLAAFAIDGVAVAVLIAV